MAVDTGVTVGVIVAALLIQWTGWLWLDPAVSLLVAVVLLISTSGLLRNSVMLALDDVPLNIDLGAVRQHLCSTAGVDDVHDLHIWGLSTTEIALTAHLVCIDQAQSQQIPKVIPAQLQDMFGITHSIQIETPPTAEQCRLRSDQKM